jgi:hypothetical protein
LGEGSELGIEAKVCELSDEVLGTHVLGAAIEMVGTEILELRAVLEHVVDVVSSEAATAQATFFGPRRPRRRRNCALK